MESSKETKIHFNASNMRYYVYYFAVFLVSLGNFYIFEVITSYHSENHLYFEKSVLSLISSFFNLFVLTYHFTNPPHPKFLMLKRRKISIYTHIISGVLEFVMCLVTYFTGNQYTATIAALSAILAHVPSASYQTLSVFGSKAIMIFSYIFVISLHFFCAIHLILEPTSSYWLLNMFIIKNIYVWCRVFFFFFNFSGVFQQSLYSNSILISGLILIPAVLGAIGNLYAIGYIGTCIVLFFIIVNPNESEKNLFSNERTRELIVNPNLYNQWIKMKNQELKINDQDPINDRMHAKKIFDSLDDNNNGILDGEEIITLLKEFQTTEAYIKRISKNSSLNFEQFYKYVWGLSKTYNVKEKIQKRKVTPEEKCRFVFDILDADGDQYITRFELQKLLIQWGLPENEMDEYLIDDEDKVTTFDEFYNNMKPIWDFAYDNIVSFKPSELN